MGKLTICLDVGGTYIKGALFSNSLENNYSDIHYYPSNSNMGKEKIVENFEHVFHDLIYSYDVVEREIEKIAIAFPGPFDYENGISYIKNLGKFDELYEVNILKEIKKLQKKPSNSQFKDAEIFFKNDAEAFAVGEYRNSEVYSGAYFTIGTGLGSTFIIDGEKVQNEFGIPKSGMIYSEPFKESIIDDYVSAKELKRISKKYFEQSLEGQELAELMKNRSLKAKQVFNDFGETIGQAIAPYLRDYSFDEIVIGGQVSKSYEYFKDSLKSELVDVSSNTIIRSSKDTSLRILEGLSLLDPSND